MISSIICTYFFSKMKNVLIKNKPAVFQSWSFFYRNLQYILNHLTFIYVCVLSLKTPYSSKITENVLELTLGFLGRPKKMQCFQKPPPHLFLKYNMLRAHSLKISPLEYYLNLSIWHITFIIIFTLGNFFLISPAKKIHNVGGLSTTDPNFLGGILGSANRLHIF